VRLATTWSRRTARILIAVWRHGGRLGQLATAGGALGLAGLCAAVVVLGIGPAGGATALTGLPVPADQLQAINSAALSCPALTPPRLAAQIMAASAFDPQATTAEGGSGVAGLTDAAWHQWAPGPDAARSDVTANILALAHDDCDLSGLLRSAAVPGDVWQSAMAGFHSGLAAVTAARGIPAAAKDYVDTVAAYAQWYALRPEFGGPGTADPTGAPTSAPALTGSAPTGSMGQAVAVPDAMVADVVAAGQVCPTITPERVAAQLMAASAFNPNAISAAGTQGIAQFRPELWTRYAPAGASPWDASAAIRTLGVAMCDLVTQMSGLGGDPYPLALAAFNFGTEQVQQAGADRTRASLAGLLVNLAAYTGFYTADPRLNPAAPTTTTPPPTTPSSPGVAAAPVDPADGWQLTWSDEFAGATGAAPDSGKWGNNTGGDGWGNAERQYYTTGTSNAALDGAGHLAITARNDNASGLSCWYGACQYTSARLVTLGHFTQAYGRISARLKLPQGQGLWPSFIAFGDNIDSAGWPAAGEINVTSGHGNAPSSVQSGLAGPDYSSFVGDSLASGTFADAYHTFTADWYPDHISFFVDGHLFNSQYRAPTGSGWVFDHPFFLVLDLAVGGNQPGDPDASTTFPQQLSVDWVRVYRAGPPTGSVSGRIVGPGGKCVEPAGTVAGSAIQLDDCTGAANQNWTLGPDGTVRVLGLCLDVVAAGTANFTQTQLANCNGSAGQVWQAQTNQQLANRQSGRCLDATNQSTDNGTPLQIWDCWGTPNQLWTLP
jgi:beta-glucanase (GH16 family)